MRLLLSMGLKPGGTAAEPLRPRLRWLDTVTGTVDDAWVGDVPQGLHPGPDEHAELTGAHRVGATLVQTTRSEVLWFDLPTVTLTDRFSHPLLYDVHDALPLPGGGLAVTATGHDSVLVFDKDRQLVQHHWLGSGSFAALYAGVHDFRRVPFDRYKPHVAHPNHLFLLDGALYATCLALGRAVCVADPSRDLPLPGQGPHDGRWIDGLLWFTSVDGWVSAWDPASALWQTSLRVDDGAPGIPGWCRGVEVVGDRVFVGMTTLRESAWREVGRRLIRGGEGVKRPTRVVELDRRTGRVVASWPVAAPGDGTLYALHALPAVQADPA